MAYSFEYLYENSKKVMPPEAVSILEELEARYPRIYPQLMRKLFSRTDYLDALQYLGYNSMGDAYEIELVFKSIEDAVQGIIWSERLRDLKIKPAVVVEIGGGNCTFPFALSLIGFSGKYVPIDIDKGALTNVKLATAHLKFECHPILACAPDVFKKIKKDSCGLLIFGHVFEEIFAYNFSVEYDKRQWEPGLRKHVWNFWIKARKRLQKLGMSKDMDKFWYEKPSKWRDILKKKDGVPAVSKMFEQKLSLIEQMVVEAAERIARGGYMFIGQWFLEKELMYGINWQKDVLPQLRKNLCSEGMFRVVLEAKKGDIPEDWFILQKCR